MSNAPDHDATEPGGDLDAESFEWDRIRTFLRASDAPMAVIEIDTPADAERITADVRQIAGAESVFVFSPDPDRDFSWPLDWLEGHGQRTGVYLFAGLESYATDEDSARQFWTWANMQRERWQRDEQKVVFLLSSTQVDALCRHAPMLWDWIPLKFNLTGRDADEPLKLSDIIKRARTQHNTQNTADAQSDAAERAQQQQRVRLDVLRQQLLRARQRGLPEFVVRRDYAWPFLRALLDAGEADEAQRVLKSELGYEFAAELPSYQARIAWGRLEALLRQILAPEHADQSARAIRFYLERASSSQSLKEIVAPCYHFIRTKLAFADHDLTSAQESCRRMMEWCRRAGFHEGVAISWKMMGDILARQRRYEDAESCLAKSWGLLDRLGDENERAYLSILATLLELRVMKLQRKTGSAAPIPSQPTNTALKRKSLMARTIRAALAATHRMLKHIEGYRAGSRIRQSG